MAIRTNTNLRHMNLAPELRDLLRHNGMQAYIIRSESGFRLAVQGHDSPLLTYPLSQAQILALTDGGTITANKKAYNCLTSLVEADFHLPKDYVHARNANGRVAMGLHGYRIGIGEYGRSGLFGPILGWTPRNQMGYHLRRLGGQLVPSPSPMVAERPDGRLKPGELTSGGYGFYYKGNRSVSGNTLQKSQNDNEIDVLQELKAVLPPVATVPRSDEPAKAYNDLISSPVYFSNEKWQECLRSHGIIIDTDEKTVTIQSESLKADMIYDLEDEKLSLLTSDNINEQSVESRLNAINEVIGTDFATALTMDSLNSTQRISLALHPHIEEEINQALAQGEGKAQKHEEVLPKEKENEKEKERNRALASEPLAKLTKVYVSAEEKEGKCRMTAVIGGESISREISRRDYDKFLAVDDRQKMKIFSKVFNVVDQRERANVGAKVFAALAAGTVVASEVMHGIFHHKHAPDIYSEHYDRARPYFKPGVDSPQDIAARRFEAMANSVATEIRNGR